MHFVNKSGVLTTNEYMRPFSVFAYLQTDGLFLQ